MTDVAEFRQAVRAVLKPMERAERLAFLRAFPTMAAEAINRDDRWCLPLDLMVEQTAPLGTYQHHVRYLGGMAHLLPMYHDTDTTRAGDYLEALAEDQAALLAP